VIVFSFSVDGGALDRYKPRPLAVVKPDVAELENAIHRVGHEHRGGDTEAERRQHPAREAAGPPPTGISDAQAFFEAVNNAVEGDTLVSIEPPNGAGVDDAATRLVPMIRQTDRLLASGSSIKVLLPAGETASTPSLLDRLEHGVHVPHGTHVRTVVIGAGESGSDAFDRLKRAGEDHEL
jgi:hypothetical protein